MHDATPETTDTPPQPVFVAALSLNATVPVADEDATVAVAAKKMLERQVGAVVVMNGSKLAGIVTERDFNFRLVATGRDPATTTLAEIMTPNPKTFGPDTAVMEALEIMQKRAYRHIPIEQDGQIIGIVSLRDIQPVVRSYRLIDGVVTEEPVRLQPR